MRIFISYSEPDAAWAEWMAWELYEAGFEVYLQAWHFNSGDFINWMNDAIETSDWMVAVVSPAWQTSRWTGMELRAMLHKDHERVLPVRVETCELTGILRPYIAHELHILDEDQARQRLLDVLPEPPEKPGKRLRRPRRRRPVYPVQRAEASSGVADDQPEWASDSGRDKFGRWAALDVEGVVTRFRWIERGTFWMGSPEDEKGRDSDETRHQVTLTRGYWLGETP